MNLFALSKTEDLQHPAAFSHRHVPEGLKGTLTMGILESGLVVPIGVNLFGGSKIPGVPQKPSW